MQVGGTWKLAVSRGMFMCQDGHNLSIWIMLHGMMFIISITTALVCKGCIRTQKIEAKN